MKNCLLFALILMTNFAFAGAPLNLLFDDPAELQYWRVTNDDVMGGVSSSKVDWLENTLVFKGILRLERNGGFTSIYHRDVVLVGSEIKLRVKGDGRTYQFRLRMPQSNEVSYTASFTTQKDVWTEHRFLPKNFQPVFRGRLVVGAPILDFKQVVRLGFLLADKKAGPFMLQVSHIQQ